MKLVNKDRIEIIEKIEEELYKVDKYVSYVGIDHLMRAKQYVCFLKTSIYVEEQMNKD